MAKQKLNTGKPKRIIRIVAPKRKCRPRSREKR
jgi:hypothetical protein